MKIPSSTRKGPALALGGFFLSVLVLLASLGYFVFPRPDDYGFAMGIEEIGVLNHFFHTYTTASGRFAANLLYAVAPAVVGNLSLYHALALIHVAILFLAMRGLVRVCHKGSTGSAWLITLCFCAAFVAGLPSLRQTLYWLAGSIVYFVPFHAMFGLAAGMGLAAFSPEALKKCHVAVLFGLLLLAMGGNEITASAASFSF